MTIPRRLAVRSPPHENLSRDEDVTPRAATTARAPSMAMTRLERGTIFFDRRGSRAGGRNHLMRLQNS
jgi:hypothetical protein